MSQFSLCTPNHITADIVRGMRGCLGCTLLTVIIGIVLSRVGEMRGLNAMLICKNEGHIATSSFHLEGDKNFPRLSGHILRNRAHDSPYP